MQPYSVIYLPIGLTASRDLGWKCLFFFFFFFFGNAYFSNAYVLLEHTEQSWGLIKVGITWAQVSKLVDTQAMEFSNYLKSMALKKHSIFCVYRDKESPNREDKARRISMMSLCRFHLLLYLLVGSDTVNKERCPQNVRCMAISANTCCNRNECLVYETDRDTGTSGILRRIKHALRYLY